MSQPITSSSKSVVVSAQSSPRPLTPTGTPPPSAAQAGGFSEAMLRQLLANCDSGTHSFCRAKRESIDETSTSGIREALPTPPPSRRSSFLAGLALSRPGFAFSQLSSDGSSAVDTTVSAGHKDISPASPAGMSSERPDFAKPRAMSSRGLPPLLEPLPLQRSNTLPHGPMKVAGTAERRMAIPSRSEIADEKRHFDPSKEPRLLGLL